MKNNQITNPSHKQLRSVLFLKDVFYLAVSAFGGPQAHIAMMLKLLVDKRRYLSEAELLELQALCQILPGPTSTQTITAIAYKKGGMSLSFMTLIIWILPAASLMCIAAIGINYLSVNSISLEFMKFIKPVAVGFVSFAAYKITTKVVKTKTQIVLLIFAFATSILYTAPWLFPLIIIIGGTVTAREYKSHHKEEKNKFNIKWGSLIMFFTVFVIAIIASQLSDFLPIKLFESFYRNGSLIFGGGQVLIPYLQTEYVEVKKLISNNDFLTGFGLVQAMPGPVFSFSSFIGAMSSKDLGVANMILGSLFSAIGVFLPGTLLIFFVIKFWEELKKARVVKASLDGINATSSGLVCAAVILLLKPISMDWINYPIIISTFLILRYTKIPSPLIIVFTLLMGYFFTLM